ncbi:MAG: hypothetical protein ACRDGS_01370 [Chloroflexota bacterium]
MCILGSLSRSVGLGVARSLCSKHGAACVLAGTLFLAGDGALYLNQPSSHAVSRVLDAQVGQVPGCEAQGSTFAAYIPETNQFYCQKNGG